MNHLRPARSAGWKSRLILAFGLILSVGHFARGGDPGARLFEMPGAFRELSTLAFRSADDEADLSPQELVIGLLRGDQQRAYPLRVLGEHRIINDDLAGPVVVTWDTDSSSARAFEAELEGRRLTFRFQGWHLGVMVLRDNETGSLWSHVTGYALGGPSRGRRLTPLPVVVTTWEVWRQRYAGSQVPQLDYRTAYKTTFPVPSLKLSPEASRTLIRPDDRLPAAERVLGITHGGRSKAYRLDQLHGLRLDRLGDREVAIYRDLAGETSVLEPQLAGQPVTLLPTAIDGVVRLVSSDGSVIDLSGQVVAGPHTGEQLPTVNAIESKWYAWVAYHPETLVDGLTSNTQGVCQPVLLPQPPARPLSGDKPRPKLSRKERREQRRRAASER